MTQPSTGNKTSFLTVLIILGMSFIYISQINPSAVLTMIEEEYGIGSAGSTLGISIIYAPIIIFSITGTYIQDRLGLKKMFSITLLANCTGVIMNLFAANFTLFLIGRFLYGIGFGLSIPFIAAAIMHWYSPKGQVTMDCVNAVFPYATNIIVFGLTIPMVGWFGNSWKMSLAFWGILCVFVLVFWQIRVRDEGSLKTGDNDAASKEKGVYSNVIKRKEIILLTLIFIFDYLCFAVVTALLPTYLQRDYGVSIEMANNLTMIFPIAGVIAILWAFMYMNKTGRRKPTIVLGQLAKVIGVCMVYFGGNSVIGYIGIAAIGIGVSVWAPACLVVPMDLEDMTPTRVGAAFSLIMTIGFIVALIAPVVAGYLSEIFSYGFAIFICAIPCVISLVCALILRETGRLATK